MNDSSLEIDCGPTDRIRLITAADVTSAYIDGLNDPEVNRFMMIGKGVAQTRDSVIRYVEEQRTRPDAYFFGLFIENVLRGTCRLHNLTTKDADIGIALFDKSVWNQGWGSQLIQKVTNFATVELGCPCIKAGIENENVSSKNTFKKAGYQPAEIIDDAMNGASWELWVYLASASSRR